MPNAAPRPMWRSLMFVPVNVQKFVDKAPGIGADALQLDLEDSVGPADKDSARAMLPKVAETLAATGHDITVRINRPWRLAVRDLETVICPSICGVSLPKVESAAHVQAISETIAELEAERGMTVGSTILMVAVETAEGYLRMPEIAKADPRIYSMGLGSEDFGLSMGMVADDETLFPFKVQAVAAARAAGLRPGGFIGSIADYKDVEKLRAIIRRSKKFGFEWATCIHPNQVRLCNEEFAPTEAEVASAKELVAAYDKALAEGRGSVEIQGKMVDIPIAQRAQAIIRQHEGIQAQIARRAGR